MIICAGHPLLLDKSNRIILADNAANKILIDLHIFLEHPGQTTLYLTIQRYLTAKHLNDKIKIITANCHICQTKKSSKTKYGKTYGIIESLEPLQTISSDIIDPFKGHHFEHTTFNSSFSIITISDIYSRWTEVEILWETNAQDIITAITNVWISKFGPPKKLISDQGPQYISSLFKTFCQFHDISHRLASSYNPTGNSVSERINQQIAMVLRTHKGEISLKSRTQFTRDLTS